MWCILSECSIRLYGVNKRSEGIAKVYQVPYRPQQMLKRHIIPTEIDIRGTKCEVDLHWNTSTKFQIIIFTDNTENLR